MDCEYRCQGCNHYWVGYRVFWHRCVEVGLGACPQPCPQKGKRSGKISGPGPTECPRCFESLYVDWINAREVLDSMGDYWNR